MKLRCYLLKTCIGLSMLCSLSSAQQSAAPVSSAVVPRLVNFSGKAVDADGKTISGIAGVTFAIYQEQSGGVPLWIETQNVQADSKGSYTAQLGATKPDGLPLDLFTSGAARWLGVTVNGGEEQPRILLLSVPYALKAADAETVGGLPASAFVLAGAANGTVGMQGSAPIPAPSSLSAATSSDVTTSGGAASTLPLFTTATNVQSSILTQTGSGATGKIGINTATPATTLDVNGAATVRGTLTLPATGAATSTAGRNSQPATLTASVYNSSTKAAVAQNFRWQAEPAANNTAAPSGTLNLLYASGTTTPAETGLKISNKGVISFAAGQTFPTVTGNETVTGDVTASELVSTVATGTAPLKVNSTTQVANLNASFLGGAPAGAFATLGSNSFVGNQGITGGLNVFSSTNPGGPISRLGSNGVNDSDSVQIYTNSGAYLAETFVAGCDGCFVPGAQPGDGGMRVAAGQNLILGDSGVTRMTLDSAGNAVQPFAAAGFVKAMLYVNGYNPPYKILNCFNSTLTGAAATTPPCGINFTEVFPGVWNFGFGFDVDQRFFSATVAAGPANCIAVYPTPSSSTMQVFTQDCDGNGKGANFYILMY